MRRLNKNFRLKDTVEGLESKSISLRKVVEKEFRCHPYLESGISFWVSLDYKRTIGSLKNIRKNVKLAITKFEENNEKLPFEFELNKNVKLTFEIPRCNNDQKYKIGIEVDDDSSTWVLSDYIEEINYCIEEKEGKIHPYISKYNTWTLILVDSIRTANSDDFDEMKNGIHSSKTFKEVVIIDYDGRIQLKI